MGDYSQFKEGWNSAVLAALHKLKEEYDRGGLHKPTLDVVIAVLLELTNEKP